MEHDPYAFIIAEAGISEYQQEQLIARLCPNPRPPSTPPRVSPSPASDDHPIPMSVENSNNDKKRKNPDLDEEEQPGEGSDKTAPKPASEKVGSCEGKLPVAGSSSTVDPVEEEPVEDGAGCDQSLPNSVVAGTV